MDIDFEKLMSSLKKLKNTTDIKDFDKYLRLSSFTALDMDKILLILTKKIIFPRYTEEIGQHFPNLLLLIVTNFLSESGDNKEIPDNAELYQMKCIALSKLVKYSKDVLKYSFLFFAKHPSPFCKKEALTYTPKEKRIKFDKQNVSNLDIVQCCLNFLKSDLVFYKKIWNWSEFFQNYWNTGCDLQQYYSNQILALTINMDDSQLKSLNKKIPLNLKIQDDMSLHRYRQLERVNEEFISSENNRQIKWNFNSDVVTNVEGVLLSIFNKNNYKFFNSNDGIYENIVKVDSTKTNLRSLALGVSSGKAICLSGPVGSGKTTLVEYLARKTGRIAPKPQEYQEFVENSHKTVLKDSMKQSLKRKSNVDEDLVKDETLQLDTQEELLPENGFLRIQLGDQTDSKMLLGQYRCTDVPGEFVWQPGVLTQAVLNGYWLLLEDLDSATQDVCTVLTSLLENNYLSVPGFRDCLRVEPGFQLLMTLRTQKSVNPSNNSTYSLLEKYLYTVNILPLSRNELSTIICENYPKLKTVSMRIVDVFLTFSSGCHSLLTSDCISDTLKNSEENTDNLCDDDNTSMKEIKIINLPNSGRLVSTRDLLKLCRRSNPTFSVTSTECAYHVFQNAVDLFCSHLPQGDIKTELIVSIGAKLGIIPSRCQFLAKDYKPEVNINSLEILIGRVKINRSNSEDLNTKRIKLDNESLLDVDKNISQKIIKKKTPTFSFTRLASCLLERIALAVQQNEPVLLVGETGVGKTSSIQYLAHQTNHKLVVVNMNNQSDVSDLIGGFKPVDMSYIMSPLRNEFEYLFNQTFNASKNEKFLRNISVCSNRGDFTVLIKLMLKIVDTVHLRIKNKNDDVYPRWDKLEIKLLKLNSQMQNSINVSFAFIPGSLVNCIKNGDWVLLDEINLASTETLECLSTILEPDGSIILLEKGDFVPIKRHPDFRIFSCMNPNTDVGKKDLPVGIRNRFTEFFLDELTTENDLLILVGDYLNYTGVQKIKILQAVKLYRRLRELSQLELNDGLGNKPVFSLRTLCRALLICSKNLCGSIERNLFESFCVSFLTQLDPMSHKLVLHLITSFLVNDAKQVLSQPIPMPKIGKFINFEGYWIEQGCKEPLECENYILTNSVKNNLRDLARIISIGKLPILLQGPTSAGKTSLIEYIAKKSGNYCLRINNHEHTDLQEYIGTYVADVSGKLVFKEGVLVQAMRQGFWIILDELNLAPSDILEALNRVLDDNRELFIPETQVLIKAHSNFMLFATQNPPGLYGGRKTLSRAFKNRFIELHFSEIPKPELEIILEKRCLIPKSYAQKMVKTMSELQMNRRSTSKNNFTLRDLFRWGNRYSFADKRLLEDTKYDWNQHLIDEGYLVLSSKVRNSFEVKIIEDALFTNFRKRILIENLFSLNENTSKVTRQILENVLNHKNFLNIVWTMDMRRMAILTAKALQFDEPVLLVGPTGCGKTTICQILSDIQSRKLRILNCHMHTEGADFLGGLRPFRDRSNEDDEQQVFIKDKQLFEWSDGPLILSMLEGGYFLADEISLAEDSVLERLNCVLEPERTILLAEKGGVNENFIFDSENKNKTSGFVIQATSGFQLLATMNPGGDFGKKELSPALRNRFTEIWCRPTESSDDLIRIAEHSLALGFNLKFEDLADKEKALLNNYAKIIIRTVEILKVTVEKLNFSIRDVLAWVSFIGKNSNFHVERTKESKSLAVIEAFVYGLETIFLDSLEMLPHENESNIDNIRKTVLGKFESFIDQYLNEKFTYEKFLETKGKDVITDEGKFGIHPFYIELVPSQNTKETEFMFTAPTTQKNLFRLLSALSLKKAILLEGAPGVGKTSLIENLASSVGYSIVRINLCEHTDLADLFGTDLPADDKTFDLNNAEEIAVTPTPEAKLGSFVWRDGPLLSALKAKNTWILLDELNLAPQSVLEGLNAILDHRGEVYIPELNKTFKLGQQTRIFAAQNPLRQGGGRKGLPQSFLNRFTKVYLKKLDHSDLLHVVKGKYLKNFTNIQNLFLNNFPETELNNTEQNINLVSAIKGLRVADLNANTRLSSTDKVSFDLAEKMVTFSEMLEIGISNLEFGYKGGPFEANLRDILRWCDLFFNSMTGIALNDIVKNVADFLKKYDDFLLVLFEKMKLVYYQRMRADSDKVFILNIFSNLFECNAETLESKSKTIGVFWTDKYIYLNDIILDKNNDNPLESFCNLTAQKLMSQNNVSTVSRTQENIPLLLSNQIETLKNLTECVLMGKPVILCGPNDSGKTKSIDLYCTLTNKKYDVDTIDDTVTGSFQQFDFNRHLEEISTKVEVILYNILKYLVFKTIEKNEKKTNKYQKALIKFLSHWENYNQLTEGKSTFTNQKALSDELILFKKRLDCLVELIEQMETIVLDKNVKSLKNILFTLKSILNKSDTLNTGGHFEWVDSKIVKSIKFGQYICLEHVNLCSSAILDRLNPIFEPNGSLLISEKGVDYKDECEVIEKHDDFRAFLTLDPKNGEISRAMRNRCIELSLNKESYSQEDIRKLIYTYGVPYVYMINTILEMHNNLKSISEFNSFGIAHIMKLSFLVSQNMKMGVSDDQSLMISALEVYVRSSNIDLLGFGLSYYRNKLKEFIAQDIKNMKRIRNIINFDNLILRANDLTSLKLIKLQCEPLISLLKCVLSGDENYKYYLENISFDFNELKIKLSDSVLKYLFYIIYEVSSKDDIEQRRIYLDETIRELFSSDKGDDENKDMLSLLLQLNQKVTTDIAKYQQSTLTHLPWNSKIYPRIREYRMSDINNSDQYKMSSIIILRLILREIKVMNTTKLTQIDVISYSKAVAMKTITDSSNNDLIKNIFKFLIEFENYIENVLTNDYCIDEEKYLSIIASYLWINRYIKLANRPLLINKKINENLMDNLMLHFKWLDKHCLKLFSCSTSNNKNDSFIKTVQKMQNFILSKKHPLSLFKKIYYKNLVNFLPFYDRRQIDFFLNNEEFNDSISLNPKFAKSLEYDDYLKRLYVMYNSEVNEFKRWWIQYCDSINDNIPMPMGLQSINSTDDELQQLIYEYNNILTSLQVNENAENIQQLCQDDYNQKCEEIKKIFVNTSTVNVDGIKFSTELFPIMEYFVFKIAQSSDQLSNNDFYSNIKSLNLNILRQLNLQSKDKYKIISSLWLKVNKYLQNMNTVGGNDDPFNKFENLLKILPTDFYKNYSTFERNQMKTLLAYELNSLCLNNTICYNFDSEDSYNKNENVKLAVCSPLLTNTILSVVLAKNGTIRETGLGQLVQWKKTLKTIKSVLFNNMSILNKKNDIQNNKLQKSIQYSNKLLIELGYVKRHCQNLENYNFSDFNEYFQKLADELSSMYSIAQYLGVVSEDNDNDYKDKQFYLSSMMHTLLGSIELNLMSYMPLLDPVEKNHLKKQYNEEDIDHFENLKMSYRFMGIVMNFNSLGEEMIDIFSNKIDELTKKNEKFSKKVATRPDACVYAELVKDINHFLVSMCHPKILIELVEIIKTCLEHEINVKNMNINVTLTKNNLQKTDETIKRIQLWLNNVQQFENHNLVKYSAYYRDFIGAIEYSITMLKYGLNGLMNCLIASRDRITQKPNGAYYDIDKNGVLTQIIRDLVQFPSSTSIDVLAENNEKTEMNNISHKVNIFSAMDKLSNSEVVYFRLIKSKIMEIQNSVTLQGQIDGTNFADLDKIINVCNQIWQKQEYQRRKKKQEEDSLYLTKTHCEEENEEVVIQQEIHDIFPSYVDDDFAEFIQNDTLEQVIKIDKNKRIKNLNDVISSDDYELLTETFIYLMKTFTKSNYYNPKLMSELDIQKLNFITPYKIRTSVFYQLFNKYKTCLNNGLDSTYYTGLNFLIGLCQEQYDDLELRQKKSQSNYNFYKDSNITEIIQCVDVLKKIEKRVHKELEQWPDHAVLNDIILIIQRIYSLPSTSSIVRFNTGLQLLRQKIDEWNSVAHKLNNLRDLEQDIVELVHRWMRMELQYWRECLSQTYENLRSKAYRYWFFVYNLLHEYLRGNSSERLNNLLDYEKVEKYFGEQEDDINMDSVDGEVKKDVSINDVVIVLKKFLESSNYAEFDLRLKILKSFEQYLCLLNVEDTRKKSKLISVLYNLHMYFEQFLPEIVETAKTKRSPIEKKLKEFVKIESFNKDLSYFSMKNNIARVHRQLHKFLKEFEVEMKTLITSVFSQKDPKSELNFDNEKGKNLRFDTKVKYYMVDVKNFLTQSRLKDKYISKDDQIDLNQSDLLRRAEKLFLTSRNIVKQTIVQSPFPNLIFTFDTMIFEQIETCEYLRNLEVDRTQIKTKQKAQAKHILNQKRKSLADFYKTLQTLGLNYKTGLLQNSLTVDLTDLTIKPFNIKCLSLDSKHKNVDQHLNYLNENMDLYFYKCTFKLKLLLKVMLLPNQDLGVINIERIKGFSIELFLLVQNQRKQLGKSIGSIQKLREQLQNISQLNECLENSSSVAESGNYDFDNLGHKFESIKVCFIRIRYILEQFNLLLKCVPSECDEFLSVFDVSNQDLQNVRDNYEKIKTSCSSILQNTIQNLSEANKYSNSSFFTTNIVNSLTNKLSETKKQLEVLKNQFELNDEVSVYGKSIVDLLKFIDQEKNIKHDLIDHGKISVGDSDLENILHAILLSMQNIYKKYSSEDTVLNKSNEDSFSSAKSNISIGTVKIVEELKTQNGDDENEDERIVEQHLKERIQKEMLCDLDILNIQKICLRVSNTLEKIKHMEDNENLVKKIIKIFPILEQYSYLVEYYLIQQVGAHKVTTKMLSVMLTVFIELGSKGFCIPPDLMEDEDKEQNQDGQKGEGFGFEDGEGEKDASDKLESEDQLDDARKPGEEKDNKEDKDCKEEKGIDMSEDFDAKMQDLDKKEDDSDSDDKEDEKEEEDLDKQMGETEEGAEKLDEQIWGSDEEKEESEEESDKKDEEGKGSGEGEDQHNNLDTEQEQTHGDEEEGLDAAENEQEGKKKDQQKDIDKMPDEKEETEEQINPYHNELEEPPEAEPMDLNDDMNMGDEDPDKDENQENPFDIDKMKDITEIPDIDENMNEDGEEEKDADKNEDADESSEEEEGEENLEKLDENQKDNENEVNNDEPEMRENPEQIPDLLNEDEKQEENKEEKKNANDENNHESKDNKSKEENIQAMPENKNKGTNDEVQTEQADMDAMQENEMDDQDTGEDKEGIGQAENEESKSGHEGIAETKETQQSKNKDKQNNMKEKRKQGNTNEERSLGDPDKAEDKKLKTIDKLNKDRNKDENSTDNDDTNKAESEEYQHVQDAKQSDKTTLDNATEEQSKQIQHEENKETEKEADEKGTDELMDVDGKEPENTENISELESEELEQKSDKPALNSNEPSEDKIENIEKGDVEGDAVITYTVPRGDETSAHCVMDILNDVTMPEEETAIETLDMRKMYEAQMTTQRLVQPGQENFEEWQQISNKMMPSARELCEQLRLILEPTKCTRLKGDYRTGRRINMRKIIPYIASQFRKDKIWLRRTKPAQRDYKITIAVDDSKSMDHNNSKNLTLQAISLVSQALTLLESGKLNVLSFGESPQILMNYNEQFNGAKLVNSLNFDQNKTKIAELLDFVRIANKDDNSGSDNDIFENLLLVLSDGRNIFSEGEQKVKNSVKLARLQRIFIVYIIIDNPDNKHSILDIRVPTFSKDKQSITMSSYLDGFPFPYYIIVRDLAQLPLVLSDAMRQWFELVNSEQ